MVLFDLDRPALFFAQDLLSEPEVARGELRRLGFRDPDRTLRNLQGLVEPGGAPPLPADLFRELVAAPDPDRALNNFERLTQAVFSRSAFYRALEDYPDTCRFLVHLLGSSQFLSDTLVRDPEYFYWLVETPERLSQPRTKADLSAEFAAESAVFQTPEARLNALRRLVRREQLRIGAGDLTGRPMQEVAAELSDLASVCLQRLLDLLVPELDTRHGPPQNRDGSRAEFTVIGLGKLGGRELNFSSDIDLMFVYSEEGNTGGGGSEGGPISNQVYFSRLAERILKAATEPTEEGFLYRIDMRLRPDGASGALTMPLSAYESYYVRRGELWERQMLIKARPCAGSDRLGARFLETILPFVYPRHFEVSPVEEIRRIKRRIEDHIGEKGEAETHLKLRSGGIRDIEFVVQCLQLLVGRVHAEARSGNTLEAIGQLQRISALAEAEAQALRAAYLFFRRVEHRLQMMHGLSDYTLPASEEAQRPLALGLDFPSPGAYRRTIVRHVGAVQTIYRDVFSEESEGEGRSIGALCKMEVGDAEATALLRELGFTRPEEAHRNLIYLAYGHVPRIRETRVRQSFMALTPALMPALQASADADRALSNLERLISAYGAMDTLFRMLSTHPGLRDLLLSLCTGSQYLVNLIVRNPALLDWLILPDVLYPDRSREELEAEVDSMIGQAASDDAVAAALNAFKNRELLRIGTRDLVALTDTFETFEALTLLAETILKVVYRAVYDRLAARRGVPRGDGGEPAAFAILGLGKLGGREFNFGSDLDLVFVYSDDGLTDGPESVGNLQFYIDLAQRILNMRGQSTPYGMLYPVDARLRPEGGSALLALSYDAYDTYLQVRASTWERLALSRSRVVAGDVGFGQKVLDRIERFVLDDGLSESEVGALVDIRRRMEAPGGRGSTKSIKTGPGGIVDVEFMVQALQIRYAHRVPHLRSPNTLKGLDRLVEGGYLPEDDAAHLRSAFYFLRTVEKVLRRQEEQARTRLPTDARALTALARAVGYADGPAFLAALEEKMGTTRRIFQAYLGEV